MNLLYENKTILKTIFVSISCVIGAALGSYFLYLDIYKHKYYKSGKPVAKLAKREAQVRRKLSDSFVWSHLENGESIYKKDSIQTGKGSAAIIHLNDGSMLDIGENSLIVMDDVSSLALQFLRGSFVIHKADGDRKISVTKDGHKKMEILAARLIQPDPLSKFSVYPNTQKNIHFIWEAKNHNGANTYTIQISKDKKFQSDTTKNFIVKDDNLSTQSLDKYNKNIHQDRFKRYSIQVSLDSGNYFWRVLSQGTQLTETRSFKITSLVPLSPVYPSQNEKAEVSPNSLGEIWTQFRWEDNRGQGFSRDELESAQIESRIEVSRDSNFNHLILSELINPITGRILIKNLPEGALYWRIKSQNQDLAVVSETIAFNLKKMLQTPSPIPSPIQKKEPILPYPLMVKPNPGATLDLLGDSDQLRASWSTVNGAKNYEIIFYIDSKLDQLNPIAFHEKTENTVLSLQGLKPGNYLWTIRSLDKQGRPGTPLPMRKLILIYPKVLEPPKILSPEVQ